MSETGPPEQPQQPGRPPRRSSGVRRRRRRALRFVSAGVYQLTVRLAVNAVAVVLFLYFAVNSAAVAEWVSATASDAVPGTITIRQVQWGPDPGRLRVIRPEVRDPNGHLVLSAEWLRVEVRWFALLGDVIAGRSVKTVAVRQVELVGPRLALEEDDRGRLRLALAFSDPNKAPEPEAEPGPPLKVRLSAIALRNAAVKMDLAGTRIGVTGLGFGGEAELRLGGPGGLHYRYSARGLQAKRGHLWLRSFEESGLAQLPAAAMRVARLEGDPSVVRLFGVVLDGEHTDISRGDVVVQLQAEGGGVDVKVTDTDLATSTAEPFLSTMLGASFASRARMSGDVHVTPRGATHVRGKVSGSGKMSGFVTRSVSGDLAVDVLAKPGEVVSVRAEKLAVEAFGGRMQSDALTYRLTTEGDMRTRGVVAIDEVSVGEVLRSEAIGMSGDTVAAMAGSLSGRVETDVQLRIDKPEEADGAAPGGAAKAGGADGAKPVLTLVSKVGGQLSLKRAADAKVLRGPLPELHLRGQIDTVMTPKSDPPQPLTVELGQVLVSERAAKAGGPRRDKDTLWLFADGAVDVHRQRVELRVDGNLPSLAPLLTPFGVKGVGGAVRLDDVGVHGPWLAPTVAGQVRARNLVAAGQTVSRAQTHLKLGDGKLVLGDLRADIAYGKVRGDLELDLYRKDLTDLRKHMTLRGSGVRVSGVDLGRLLKPYGVTDVQGVARLAKTTFSMDLSAPLATAKARTRLHIDRPVLRHERLSRLDAGVRFSEGRVTITGLEMAYRQSKLAALAPQVSAPVVSAERIDYTLDTGRFVVKELRWPQMPFSRIGEVAALKMPLKGSISAHVPEARGDARGIAFKGSLRFRELGWDTIYMGDAEVSLVKGRKGPATVTSERFFERFDLLDGSKVHFTKVVPMWMALNMRTRRLDPMAFLGLAPIEGMRMLASGDAVFTLDFRPGRDVFSVVAKMPTGGAELELGNGLDPVANLAPSVVTILPDRVDIGSISLPMGRERFELCGAFLYPNAAKGTPSILRLYLAGALDVPRVGALAESMASLDMRLGIEKDPLVALDKRSRCLTSSAAQEGVMRIAGPLDAMIPQGRLRLLSGRMTPRGYGKEIVLNTGARLELAGLPKGKLRLRIPVDARLDGQIEEGRFSTWGDMLLNGYSPERISWRFDGVDLAHTVPKEYGVVATMQLTLNGEDLSDEKRQKLKLGGKVKITEGSYSKSFDKLGTVISGVRGRELEAYSEPLLERMPWVGRIGLDLEVDGTDFLVLSRFPFGKTDMELGIDVKVQGTVADMKVYDRVEIQPGSVLSYSVVKRDFEVTRGTVDFSGDPLKGIIDLEAKTEIELNAGSTANANSVMSVGPNLSSTSGSALREKVTVIIRISGPLDDTSKLDIQLDSVPPYSQGDIQALILTGTTQQSGSGALGSRSSINLLTDDLAKAVSDMLLSAFVDKVSVGIPTNGGGITATVQTNLGKYMTLRGDIYSQGTSQFSTGRFTFLLPLEGLYLESLLIRNNANQGDVNSVQNVFEGRIRWRLTLDD